MSKSRVAAFAAVGLVALLLVGSTFLRSKKPAPTVPESLLRKVERASATPASPPPPPRIEEASSGVPPMPSPASQPPQVSTAHAPVAQLQREAAPPPPERQQAQTAGQTQILSTSRPRVVARKRAEDAAPEGGSVLEFGQRLGGDTTNSPNSKTPVRYHVETGARIRVALDVNLDSRTVTGGPAAVRLRRAYISNGRVVFPAGTMAYGEARANNSRFTIRFTRLVLPDKTEVPFESLAYDIQDRKPGLAPSRRIAGVQQQDGTGTKVGRAVANTMLTAVNGGLAQDAARNAAETALNSRDSEGIASGGDALLLDAGAEMDMLVTKPF